MSDIFGGVIGDVASQWRKLLGIADPVQSAAKSLSPQRLSMFAAPPKLAGPSQQSPNPYGYSPYKNGQSLPSPFRSLSAGSGLPNPFGGGSSSIGIAPNPFSSPNQFRDNPFAAPNKTEPPSQANGKRESTGTGSGADLTATGDASGAQNIDGVRKWDGLAEEIGKQYGVPKEVLQAIMAIESGGDPNVGTSADGAVGLMQVVPKYWQSLADQFGGNLNDPRTALTVAAQILKQSKEKYGTWDLAAGAYLAGSPYSTATDSNGTDAQKYMQQFRDNLAALGYGQTTTTPIESSSKVIQTANQFQGQPYVWGGSDPSTGFDCSGLVQWSFGQSGVALPRTAQEQYDATTRINASDLQPGDLVFFSGTYAGGPNITHVGIYIGNGQMIDSQTAGIVVDNLSDPYWQNHLAGFGRVNG